LKKIEKFAIYVTFSVLISIKFSPFFIYLTFIHFIGYHCNRKKNKESTIRLIFLIISSILFTSLIIGCQQKTTVVEKTEPVKIVKKVKKPTISVQAKKANFKKLLIPAVQEVFNELSTQYKEIEVALETNTQSNRINQLKKTYKVKTNEELLLALKPHPISLTLAQAAMESSWGTSRFFKQANNVFGVWSFNKKEPRIAASGQRGNKTIWLKKYSNIKESVRDYYKNMGRSFAFEEFRIERHLSNDPLILVTKLDRYSEKGAAYGVALSSVITYNKFMLYDEKIQEELTPSSVTLNEVTVIKSNIEG